MNKTIAATLSSAALLIISACNLLPSSEYKEPHLYDIGIPLETKSSSQYEVSIQPFSSDAAVRYKMIYRMADNRLDVDEYNRWTQPPGQMITKYLRLAFADDSMKNAPVRLIVSGTVLAFEADFAHKVARFCISYKISDAASNLPSAASSFTATIPLESNTPGAVAKSMSKAVEEFQKKLTINVETFAQELTKYAADQKALSLKKAAEKAESQTAKEPKK